MGNHGAIRHLIASGRLLRSNLHVHIDSFHQEGGRRLLIAPGIPMKHGCRRIARALLILVVMLGTTVPNAPPVSASSSGYASYHFEPSPNYTQNDSKAVLKIVADNSGLPAHQVTWKDPQGNIAACPGCSTTYDYSANGGIISSTSDFFIAGQQRVSLSLIHI